LRGSEFLRKLKKLGRRRGVAVSFDPQHGDGSHRRLHEMCSELGIGEKDLEGR
jgi:hypothetical protein